MPSVPPAPVLVPLRALEGQRPPPRRPGGAALPCSCGSQSPGRGRGTRDAGEPRQGFLPQREHPSDQARFAAGTAGLGRLPRTRIAPPPSPSPQTLRWPRAGAPGPGDRRRAGGRRSLLRGTVGRGGGVCRVPPGGDLGAIILKNKGDRGRLGAPPGPALNLNLYLTLCPEGGEGTHLSSDGGSSVHLSFWGGGEPALLGAGREPGISRCPWAQVRPKRPRTQGLWGPRVPSERRGANQAVGLPRAGVDRGPESPPSTPTPSWTRPAAVAARGRSDSLHVASAAAIQQLIER